jgi:hypothetical protein
MPIFVAVAAAASPTVLDQMADIPNQNISFPFLVLPRRSSQEHHMIQATPTSFIKRSLDESVTIKSAPIFAWFANCIKNSRAQMTFVESGKF